MKKHILTSVLSVLLITSLFGLEVNEDEIRRAGRETIEFINYTGPHRVIDSVAAIRGIGSNLGQVVGKSVTDYSTAGNASRYYVIHAVDSTSGKLDADILVIGSQATVDHIVNLRRIISAYLSTTYGYSTSDGDTLATFITVYNAVYRGNKSYFSSKYKDVVVNNLSDNCGLSINYRDWPGKSEIVIPLYDVANGGLSTVDTSVISDSKVIDTMKTDDDKNVDSRKDMVDLKEREAESASEKAKEAQKTAVAEQKKLDEQKKKTEEAKKQADTAKKEADTAKKEADTAKKTADDKKKTAEANPNDKKAQEEAKTAKEEADKKQEIAEEKQEVAEEKQEEAEKEEEKLAEQEAKTEEAKEEAEEKQELADKKQSEAMAERKEIAKDQQIVQQKEIEAANAAAEYGLVITDDEAMLSRLVKYNKETGEVIKNSPVSVIRSRTIYKISDGYLAIAGESANNGTVKLVVLDTDTMEIIGESSETIADNSVLVQDGEDYYCVVKSADGYYVGKFDENLTLKLKSNVKALDCTPITVTEDNIVITSQAGKLQLLNKKDLTAVTTAAKKSTETVTTSRGNEK